MSRPVALITGGSSGIGRAIAEALSPSHHLIIAGRDRARVAEVVEGVESAEAFIADLTDPQACAAGVANLTHLDVLVHSAGLVAYGPLEQTTNEQWNRVLALNVIAPATLTRLLLPALRSASGLVVFVNSGAGLVAHPSWSVYAASKFALTALADALRAEERGRLRVTSLHPGRVATPMQAELNALEGRDYRPEQYLDPADVARAVRAVVDLPPGATLDSARISPSH